MIGGSQQCASDAGIHGMRVWSLRTGCYSQMQEDYATQVLQGRVRIKAERHLHRVSRARYSSAELPFLMGLRLLKSKCQ